jgi:hypothetical protein
LKTVISTAAMMAQSTKFFAISGIPHLLIRSVFLRCCSANVPNRVIILQPTSLNPEHIASNSVFLHFFTSFSGHSNHCSKGLDKS